MKRFITVLSMYLGLAFVVSPLASAHVVVTPKQAQPADYVTFSVSVPNEKDVPMTELRLAIPSGLREVTPTVQSGWTIDETKSGDTVTDVTWKGSEIPGGQREDFTVRAQTPANTGDLQWKAYQRYADGTIVAWDQKPSADGKEAESETAGPYSVTNIVKENSVGDTAKTDTGNSWMLAISLLALLLSIFSLLRRKTSR